MWMMNLDNALWISTILVEAALVGQLIHRRVWRTAPFFLIYCSWEVVLSVGAFPVLRFAPNYYPLYYLLVSIVDFVLEFAVLVELTWSVLRPIRSSLPRKAPLIIALVLLLIAAALWPVSGLHALAGLPKLFAAVAHVQQTTSILRVIFFLALAASSQFLAIGWRDRELQIATGLGLVSLVTLGTAMLHTHESSWGQWLHLNQIQIASYGCALIYWVYCFAQKEAERREFTPQMQNLLLAVAGVAKAERTALTAASARARSPKEQ
jgi:hypothetical protein